MHGNRKASIPGFLNRPEFAALIGSSYQRVVGLAKSDNPPPFNSDGYITLADAAEWQRRNLASTAGADYLTRERMIAQTRKDSSVAERNEIANRAREAELIEASEVAAGWAEIAERMEARFARVPAEAAAALALIPADAPDRQVEIVEALRDVIHAALTDVSAGDE